MMLSQSCVVYNTNSVNLKQAQNKGKVKLTYENGRVYKFDNILVKDNIYYGIGIESISETQHTVHEAAIMLLDSTKISSIFIKDIGKSKRRTSVLAKGTITAAFIVGGIIYLNFFLHF